MFGECKVCNEKDRRILDLIKQIENLNKLVFPSTHKKSLPIIEVDSETGAVTSRDPDMSDDEIAYEADAILTNNYDNN